jgi:hypothetical protein
MCLAKYCNCLTHCGLVLGLRNVIVGICNRQAGTRLPMYQAWLSEVFPCTAADCWILTAFLLSVSAVARSPLATGQRGPAGRPAGSCLSQAVPSINQTCQFKRHSVFVASDRERIRTHTRTKPPGFDPQQGKRFFFSSSQLSEWLMGAECNRGFFIRGVKITVHMSLVPKLRMHGALPPLPHTFTVDVCDETRVTLLF